MSTNETTIGSSELTLVKDTNEEVVFPPVSQRALAWEDIKLGLSKWRIWLMLAYQDTKIRYRRSVLGPFWITLSMAITVYSMGYLYSHLFHMAVADYFPYLVSGMLSWHLVSSCITDMTDTFINYDTLLKQIKLPYSLYIHRVATKNFIVFFHNILVFVPVVIIFHDKVNLGFHQLLLIPGLFIIYFNSITYGIVFAMIGSRYRDMSQVIRSLVQVIFFVTPIMWNPAILPPNRQFIAKYNPIFSVLELVRSPLIGYSMTMLNLLMVAIITLIGIGLCYVCFVSRRSRIIYWL